MPQVRTSIGKDFQDVTLDRLITRGMVTTIYLRNRMSLRGRVRDFDPYVILLEPLDGTPIQLVYKSAIVSVSGPPRRPMGPRRSPGGPRPPRGPGFGGGPRREGRSHRHGRHGWRHRHRSQAQQLGGLAVARRW